jgi:hypothetical protein
MNKVFRFRESNDLHTDIDKCDVITYPKSLLFELLRKRVKNS